MASGRSTHTPEMLFISKSICRTPYITQICQRYPNAERIYLIQDNRAIHFHANSTSATDDEVDDPTELERETVNENRHLRNSLLR